MGRAYLLTGRPGVGKTTCLRKVLELLQVPAGGFFTEEIREHGKRVGFALLTLNGRRTTLAHVNRSGGPRVGKYRVNLAALDRAGVPAIRDAVRKGHLVVADEIGKMELAAPAFRQAVAEALESPVTLLGTILSVSHPWADRIKAHPAVQLIEVTRANRDSLPSRLAGMLASPGWVVQHDPGMRPFDFFRRRMLWQFRKGPSRPLGPYGSVIEDRGRPRSGTLTGAQIPNRWRGPWRR